MCAHVCQTGIPETGSDNVSWCVNYHHLCENPISDHFLLHSKCVPIVTVWLAQRAQRVDAHNSASVFNGESANMWSQRYKRQTNTSVLGNIHSVNTYSLFTTFLSCLLTPFTYLMHSFSLCIWNNFVYRQMLPNLMLQNFYFTSLQLPAIFRQSNQF